MKMTNHFQRDRIETFLQQVHATGSTPVSESLEVNPGGFQLFYDENNEFI